MLCPIADKGQFATGSNQNVCDEFLNEVEAVHDTGRTLKLFIIAVNLSCSDSYALSLWLLIEAIFVNVITIAFSHLK